MSNQTEILNPLTHLLYLPPDIAYQSSISTYFILGSTGAFTWDILSNVDLEYKILFNQRVTFSTVAYFLSRCSVLTYSLLTITLQTAPLGKLCQSVEKAICVIFHLVFSSTSLLFFLRVRAVFERRRRIVIFFFILWLAVLGGSLTIATGSDGATELAPTRYCQLSLLKEYIAVAPITLTVFDTLVFLAISWHLLAHSFTDPHKKSTLPRVLLGQSIPAFSRAILQDGQVYYLISVTSNLAVIAITFIPGISPIYRYMFMFNSTLTNMMACKVFRSTKFDAQSSVYPVEPSGSQVTQPQETSLNDSAESHVITWHAKAMLGAMVLFLVICLAFCIPRKS
ncbi:hypothetical protein Hypma_009717 [Hypsizygus marmoreus]|uniref:G-protein coupled receptors family 1 profile domain-containing protein n=1 Tax=Hypsizygus marmoreus TaxID=39966 RepID=A0A369JWC1_HYPMA|nr:hypothetical protein Hypma_009717 [Hypsizygus marmoreus]